jgi:6-phosphofructokinase 1
VFSLALIRGKFTMGPQSQSSREDLSVDTIGVITSGGDAPGMNAALRAVVRAACNEDVRVLGIRHAYRGVIDGEHVELDRSSVAGLSGMGGTMIKTARCKEWMTPEGRARGAQRLRDMGVEGLVVIGGDGSFTGAHMLEKEHGIPCIGVPGTIDNDLYGTDYTIGFHTAVNTAVEMVDKIRDTAESHERLFLVEVMGRHSGQIAAAVGLACGAEEILVPEEKTHIEKVREVLAHAKRRGKRSLIVIVAEGDDEGGVFELQRKLALESNFDIRCSVLGHVQRGGVPSAFDRILGVMLGEAAVSHLLKGKSAVMVGVRHLKVKTIPIEEAYTKKEAFDQKMIQLARLLS